MENGKQCVVIYNRVKLHHRGFHGFQHIILD